MNDKLSSNCMKHIKQAQKYIRSKDLLSAKLELDTACRMIQLVNN